MQHLQAKSISLLIGPARVAIAFLVTNPYQLFHYKWIASHFEDIVALLEVRDTDFGLNESFIKQHLPKAKIEYTTKARMAELDGKYDVIVCQTPILPLEFLSKTYVVAQQYSLAKEKYQYGPWRAHAHLNLMYGNYSVRKVQGFANAVAVGNPLFDPFFKRPTSLGTDASEDLRSNRRVLYLPTYGELSSLDSMLPHLGEIDASIVIKLHHAHEHDGRVFPDNVSVVHSDTDPIALLQTSDVVLSDLSGAAFDALYAGLPLILTGHADPKAKDYGRLSTQELGRHALADTAAVWTDGSSFDEVVSFANERARSPHRQDLIDRYFVNSGKAGAACADEIRSLIEQGETASFGVHQVRETTRRYIVANRELRMRLKGLQGASRARTAEAPGRTSRARNLNLSRRTRRFAARLPLARRLFRRERHRRDRDARAAMLPEAPRERREAIWELLDDAFAEAGARSARGSKEPGAEVAVLDTDLEAMFRALRNAGRAHPYLTIDVKSNKATIKSVPIGSVALSDLQEAKWFQIGSDEQTGTLRPGKGGHLTLLVAQYDVGRSRYLAHHGRAQRVDWTAAFADVNRAHKTMRSDDRVEPVAKRQAHLAGPIDLVYTWVDSTDKEWRRLHAYYSSVHVAHNESVNNDERYINREELRYSLRSVWMFAPFVRNIYIVTADQRPPWLGDDPRVTIVPHTEIFPNQLVLPTFNSHAIESCLHRIEGLAENFVYFNDDIFLGREVSIADFFTMSGLVKSRLSPSQFIYDGQPNQSAIPTDWAAYNAVSLLNRDYGIQFDRKLMHVPHPLKRSVMYEIEERYPEEVTRTREARFRAPTDIAIPSMFGQYYAIATARATEWRAVKNEYIYVDTGREASYARYEQILRKHPKFFCLNVTRYDELDLEAQAAKMAEFLSGAFPSAAPWEADS